MHSSSLALKKESTLHFLIVSQEIVNKASEEDKILPFVRDLNNTINVPLRYYLHLSR